MFAQQTTTEILKGKDSDAIDESTEKCGEIFNELINRTDAECHTVNREHPDGGLPDESTIFF